MDINGRSKTQKYQQNLRDMYVTFIYYFFDRCCTYKVN